jgi:hypothetical protein
MNVNEEVYMNIFEELCAQLLEKERQNFLFQRDGAFCHNSRVSLQRVNDVFSEERTVSKNLWPPNSHDLTTCDYFLWGHLKSPVYKSNPHTIEELNALLFYRVYLNMIRGAQLYIYAGGNHFHHLI